MSQAQPILAARAKAHANIALIKYWGKRDEKLHLPAAGSLSLTLDGLWTETLVHFDGRESDALELNGEAQSGAPLAKVQRFLDLVRAEAPGQTPGGALVRSVNHVPTAAGLASSASAFAALAMAADAALGLALGPEALSRLARRGSGSACRSLFGGFARWNAGVAEDGLDSHAVGLSGAEAWGLRLVVAVVEAGPKPIGSREGMALTAQTSPFYPAWVAGQPADLAAAEAAIQARDLPTLGALAERNAMKMHATMLAAEPPFCYWRPASVACLEAIRGLRAQGIGVWATMDAGPNVKALCAEADAPAVAAALRALPGVAEVGSQGPGPAASVLARGAEALAWEGAAHHLEGKPEGHRLAQAASEAPPPALAQHPQA